MNRSEHPAGLQPLEARLLLSSVLLAQTGFNDAAGIHADAAADSPYVMGAPVSGQGRAETDWSRAWSGGDSTTIVSSDFVFEGDGALRFIENDFLTRRIKVAQQGEIEMDFRVYFEPGHSGDIRLFNDVNDQVIDIGVGPQLFFASSGIIHVKDQEITESTGIGFAFNQWHHVRIIADVPSQTWRLVLNGVEYLPPDPLDFRRTVPVLDGVMFFLNGAWLDQVEVRGQPLAPINPNSLLVANGDTLREYTRTGSLVQEFAIESPVAARPTSKDLEVDLHGRIHVWTISDQHYLSTFDPADGSWQHNTLPGWDLPGTTYYGNLAVTERFVYAADHSTGPDPASGIIRFDLSDLSSVTRLPTVLDPHTVTYGLDGRIYVLNEHGNAAVHDPVTFELIKEYPFQALFEGSPVTAMAVDFNGDIFTSDLDRTIYRHDNDGNLIEYLLDTNAFVGMGMIDTGEIVAASTAGVVTVTDRNLNSFITFATPDIDTNYATFARPMFRQAPPRIEHIALGGSAWTDAFRTAADELDGVADGAHTLPAGADQTAPVPWFDLDQIIIRFSNPVDIAQGSLSIFGINIANYGPLVTAFDFDSATSTATWTLASALAADKLRLVLSGDVTGAGAGPALDGEWTDGVSTISGDGAPGGQFAYRLNVLPGDTSASGGVLGDDVILVRNAQFTATGDPGFDPAADVNGDGVVLGDDVILVRNSQFTMLPAGEPPGGTALSLSANESLAPLLASAAPAFAVAEEGDRSKRAPISLRAMVMLPRAGRDMNVPHHLFAQPGHLFALPARWRFELMAITAPASDRGGGRR